MVAKCIRRQKNIIYKRAEFTQSGLVLETLLQKALDKFPKPAARREVVGSAEQDSKVRRVIGASRHERAMACGSLLLYEIGKDVAFVIEDEEADEFIVESQNPAKGLDEGDTRKREVLESALYFGIFGEHVVLVQSHALKARDLENHLKWLLTEHAKVLDSSVGLALCDEPTKAARERIENLPVKSVELGAPVVSEEVAMQGMAIQEASTKQVVHRIAGKGRELISSLLGEDVLAQLKLESALDDSNLEVTLQLRYKRSTDDSGHKALDHIARAMRHAEPEDTKVITSTGTVLKGESLKLAGHISVGTYNGIVDTEDLYSQMFAWLEERIAEGSVGQ